MKAWNFEPQTGKRYVYLWADGIYCNVGLEPDPAVAGFENRQRIGTLGEGFSALRLKIRTS